MRSPLGGRTNIFQHCPGKWGGGGGSNKKCGQKKIQFIYIRTKCSKFWIWFFFVFYFFILNYLHGFFHVCARLWSNSKPYDRGCTHTSLQCLCALLFLWTLIASKLLMSVWGQIYPFLPRQVGICFCWLCLLQNVPSHLGHPQGGSACHGPPACATRPCTACHSQMDGHQLSMCQKCTGAGASFHAGSYSACKRVCLSLPFDFLSHSKHAHTCPACCFSMCL